MTLSGLIIFVGLYGVLAGAFIDTQHPTPITQTSPWTGTDRFLRSIPAHDLVVCACAKCGTTSMYNFIYQAVSGHEWRFWGRPWIQNIYSTRWNHTFESMDARDFQTAKTRIAIVRDPIQRTLSSWKSKLACSDGRFDVNTTDRARLVPEMYALAGVSPMKQCLNLKDYVDLLKIIHENGRASQLQDHFLPQHLGCFRSRTVKHWTLAARISDPVLRRTLGSALGAPPDLPMPHIHASNSRGIWVPMNRGTRAILENITRPEYLALQGAIGIDGGTGAHVAASGECRNAACGVPCTRRDGECITSL